MLAVLATMPDLILKPLWLSGSTIGVTDDAGLAEMHSARFVAGNTITLLLMALAAAFVVALTRPWADRVPASVVFVLGAGATGLLAPILLGMPLGLALQALVHGEVRPSGDTGLAPWVFGIVYSGFRPPRRGHGDLGHCRCAAPMGAPHQLQPPPVRPSGWVTPPGLSACSPSRPR